MQSEEKMPIATAFNTYKMPKIFNSIIPDGLMEIPKATGGVKTVIFLYNGCLGKYGNISRAFYQNFHQFLS